MVWSPTRVSPEPRSAWSADGPADGPLSGGTANRRLVVRVGDTVVRPIAPCWRATHALLAHLSAVGFDGAPQVLASGPVTEVLTYIDGRAAVLPLAEDMLTDAALLSVADLLRRYHRAAASFDPPGIFAPAQFRAANAVTFVVNGALGGFAFVFIPALQIIAGYSPVVAGSALVPVTMVTMLLSGPSGQLATRIGPRPPLVAGCLACAAGSLLAVRIGAHAGYWTAVFPLAVLFGLGLAALMPPPPGRPRNGG